MSKQQPNALPRGFTCGRCDHFERCAWLFGCKPDNTLCDWIPRRFVAVKKRKDKP